MSGAGLGAIVGPGAIAGDGGIIGVGAGTLIGGVIIGAGAGAFIGGVIMGAGTGALIGGVIIGAGAGALMGGEIIGAGADALMGGVITGAGAGAFTGGVIIGAGAGALIGGVIIGAGAGALIGGIIMGPGAGAPFIGVGAGVFMGGMRGAVAIGSVAATVAAMAMNAGAGSGPMSELCSLRPRRDPAECLACQTFAATILQQFSRWWHLWMAGMMLSLNIHFRSIGAHPPQNLCRSLAGGQKTRARCQLMSVNLTPQQAHLMAQVPLPVPQAHSLCMAQHLVDRLVLQKPGQQGIVSACAPRRTAAGGQGMGSLDHLHRQLHISELLLVLQASFPWGVGGWVSTAAPTCARAADPQARNKHSTPDEAHGSMFGSPVAGTGLFAAAGALAGTRASAGEGALAALGAIAGDGGVIIGAIAGALIGGVMIGAGAGALIGGVIIGAGAGALMGGVIIGAGVGAPFIGVSAGVFMGGMTRAGAVGYVTATLAAAAVNAGAGSGPMTELCSLRPRRGPAECLAC